MGVHALSLKVATRHREGAALGGASYCQIPRKLLQIEDHSFLCLLAM
jgi:hypothetical protein